MANSKEPFWISQILFCYVTPYLQLGKRGELSGRDFKLLPSKCNAKILHQNLDLNWNKSKPNLTKSLISTFWKAFAWTTFLGILKDAIFRVIQGLALGALIDSFSTNSGTGVIIHQALYATLILTTTLIMFTILNHYSMFLCFELGMRMRIGLTMLIYNKALKIDQRILGGKNIGKITTLVTNDANRFDRNIAFITYLFIGPVQVITVTSALWFYVGPISLSLPFLLSLLIPFQGWVGRKFGKLRLLAATQTDRRVRIINEIINAIKLIKMNTWEKLFLNKADNARRTELKKIKSKWNFDAINKVLFDVSSKLILLCVLALYIIIYADTTLSPTTVFVTLTLTNYLRATITNYLPLGVSGLYEIKVSIQRIKEFLLLQEKAPNSEIYNTNTYEVPGHRKSTGSLVICNFSTGWTSDSNSEPIVENVSFSVSKGQLTVLSGPVASGKSTLIQGILGELEGFTGTIKVNGSIAYASQDPWIFAGTIRENILFGRSYDSSWYETIIDACGLGQDIVAFGAGDETQVGEKGVALSGGQQARVNLARAIYGDTDIVILDDPLAAVDVKTGRWIYEKCILGLLKSKAVLLVSNNLRLCLNAHQIVILKDGKVLGKGKYSEIEECIESGIRESLNVDEHDETVEEQEKEIDSEAKPFLNILTSALNKTDKFQSRSGREIGEKKENQTTGIVSSKIYWKYFIAGNGVVMLIFFLLSAVGAQTFSTGSDYWLKLWSDAEINRNGDNGLNDKTKMRYFYIGIYGGILVALAISSFFRNFSLVKWTMNSSASLHRKVLNSLVHTSIVFYEQNSSGRILNRVINDIGNIDDNIPRLMQLALNSFLQILGSVVMTCYIQPILIPFAILLLVLVHNLRNYYLTSASQIKRTESIARSPLLAHINTTILGLSVIRSYGSEKNFTEQFIQIQNQHSRVFWMTISSIRWFSLNTDWIANGYFVVLMTGLWVFSPQDGASVGLSVSTVLMLTSTFALGISQLTNLDNEIIAVERVLEYIDLPPEESMENAGLYKWYPFSSKSKQLESFGSKGKIHAANLYVTLNEKQILKNLSFTINPGEKVGIVGRTGAGKTTLINTLYRLIETSTGVITIDGIDISKLLLKDLRKTLSIIPQLPQLFTGTIRSNLDPKAEKFDADLVQSLKDVQLWDRLEDGLATFVSDGGNNFSSGEKQLFCLARAIQNRKNILLLDEPTANVDSQTEEIINRVIKEKFRGCTILTIAHRLDTIIESDRLMVLEKGELVEFGTPFDLLQNPSGIFHQMLSQVQGTGYARLYGLAQKSHIERQTELSNMLM